MMDWCSEHIQKGTEGNLSVSNFRKTLKARFLFHIIQSVNFVMKARIIDVVPFPWA
ncbi:hypothetical protein DET47_104138 [Shewanella putrefaciens]|nr:hypothetical protein DET47_104138 [Shewanella putrefaciens]